MEIFTLIILFALCAILLAIELFVFPGISIAGIAAACCLVGANYVAFSWFGLTTGLWACAASIVACGLLGYWLMHSKTLEKYSLHKKYRFHGSLGGTTFRTPRRRRSGHYPARPHR